MCSARSGWTFVGRGSGGATGCTSVLVSGGSVGPAIRGNATGRSLAGLMVVAEGYPDLRASLVFLQLQRELTNTEDRIAAGRRFYNGNVRALNTRVRTFPSTVVARMFGFGPKEFFELTDQAAATPPTVDTTPATEEIP